MNAMAHLDGLVETGTGFRCICYIPCVKKKFICLLLAVENLFLFLEGDKRAVCHLKVIENCSVCFLQKEKKNLALKYPV